MSACATATRPADARSWGGETVVTRARNHQLAAEITHQLTDAHQVQLQYIHDLKVENGPRMRGLQFRYVYAF